MKKINDKRERLISVSVKDCRVDYYRCGGKGGQKVNKTSSAVRVTHEPSGAVGQCEDHREQSLNKKTAWVRMRSTKQFTTWLRMESARVATGKSIDDIVDEQMNEKNIKTEVRENGRFVEKEING